MRTKDPFVLKEEDSLKQRINSTRMTQNRMKALKKPGNPTKKGPINSRISQARMKAMKRPDEKPPEPTNDTEPHFALEEQLNKIAEGLKVRVSGSFKRPSPKR
jgi:hypothetical protein